VFATLCQFRPSLIFAGKAKSLPLSGVSQGLASIIRVGQKWLAVTNTLAYYDTLIITNVRSFDVQALWINKIGWFQWSLNVLLLLRD
jgi:hypothetical protein